MGAELRREQRKKELEEKRARLKALRADKKATASAPIVSAPKEDLEEQKKQKELAQLKDASNVNDLLSALELPESKPAAPEPAPAPAVESAPKEKEISKAAPAPLTLQQRVAEFDLPPKIIPTYVKGTQTVSTQLDSDNEEEQDIPMMKLPESVPDTSQTKKVSENVKFKENKEEETQEELSSIEIQRILYSQELAEFLDDATRVTQRAMLVNNKFDILASYKGETGDDQERSGHKIALQNTLTDSRWTKNRAVTSMNWSPKFPELFLASYSENTSSVQESDGVVLVWTVDNLLEKPEFVFNCQSQVLTAQFPKFQPNIILGGTYSGQLVLWDTRAKSTPVQRSPLSSIGHTHPIYCLDVVGTQNAHNLVSVSTDGTLCAWTLSNLSQPIEQLHLETPPIDGRAAKYSSPAATCLSFEEGQVNQFYIGTEEGAIYHGARHGSTRGLTERFRRAPTNKHDLTRSSDATNIDFNFSGHYAPITGLDFHKVDGNVDLSPYFLTSSLDWSVKLWNKRLTDHPVKTFQFGSSCVYDTKWSRSHPGIFATGDGDGFLNLWNIGADVEVPFIQEKVSNHSINKLAWSNDSKKILVGDATGSVFLYDVGEISTPDKEEWNRVDEVINNLPKPQEDHKV